MSKRSAREVWQAILGELQLQVPRATFQTWLRDTIGLSYEDGVFTVGTSSPFVAEWLEHRFRPVVEKTLRGYLRESAHVRFTLIPDHDTSAEAVPVASPAPLLEYGNGEGAGKIRLHPRYTFDTFVVSEGNRLAYAAAQRIALGDASLYSPLVIYGDSGLGKTHLLQAIAHTSLDRGERPLYVTAEQFTEEFVTAVRGHQSNEFRQRYREAGLLILDDIQDLSGKEQTQKNLLYTVTALLSANRPIVISSDRPLSRLTMLEPRLRSRFEGGLLAELRPLDTESRLLLLRRQVEEQCISVPDGVLELIALRVSPNIRELRGCLNLVLAHAKLLDTPITTDLVQQVLEKLVPVSEARPSPQQILHAVATSFETEVHVITGRSRSREVTLARHAAMYLLHHIGGCSLLEIARYLGGKDHSTVRYGIARVERLIEEKHPISGVLLEITEGLSSRTTAS